MAETTDEEVVETEEDEEVVVEDDKQKDEEVPVRGNKINAQRRIIDKLQKPKEKAEEDEEGLTELARKLIQSEVAKATAPLNDEIEFRDYFSEHPEDKKYQKEARKRFDAWENVPIAEIMKTLRTQIDSKERDAAIEKAEKASIKGATVRKGEEQVASTQKDYEEVYKNVKRGETGAALKKLGISK